LGLLKIDSPLLLSLLYLTAASDELRFVPVKAFLIGFGAKSKLITILGADLPLLLSFLKSVSAGTFFSSSFFSSVLFSSTSYFSFC